MNSMPDTDTIIIVGLAILVLGIFVSLWHR